MSRRVSEESLKEHIASVKRDYGTLYYNLPDKDKNILMLTWAHKWCLCFKDKSQAVDIARVLHILISDYEEDHTRVMKKLKNIEDITEYSFIKSETRTIRYQYAMKDFV